MDETTLSRESNVIVARTETDLYKARGSEEIKIELVSLKASVAASLYYTLFLKKSNYTSNVIKHLQVDI